jgi:hypothetical protein
MSTFVDVTEQKRLNEAREAQVPWKKWGPYLSERQWERSVRTTAMTAAWDTSSIPVSLSATKWGEDGLAGFSDDKQRLCLLLRCGTSGTPS